MVKEFDYKKYLVHELPISQEQYHENINSFFGKTVYDFDAFLNKTLAGRDIAIYTDDMVRAYLKEHEILTMQDMMRLYADEVYLARNICYEFALQLPPINELFNHYEFIVPLCLLKEQYPDRELYALDHGSAMGWQGILMWCFGYHITFCDLKSRYFDFLKFQCERANMSKVDFIDVTTDMLDLRDKRFDFVNSFFVFEHILNVEDNLREVTSHLNEGGYFNLRVDFSHGGLCLKQNAIFANKSFEWKSLLKSCRLKETDLFEDHIYMKSTKEV